VGALLVAGSVVVWLLRGRPALPLGAARESLRELAASRLTVLFLALVGVLLGYELVLALTVPPNNWDSLWYHLPRAVAWLQGHRYGWIQKAPTDILNTRQPVAEQELLFLFAATGKGQVFAVPQYLAEVAILVAVYGAARRLGFGVAPAAAPCGGGRLAGRVAVARAPSRPARRVARRLGLEAVGASRSWALRQHRAAEPEGERGLLGLRADRRRGDPRRTGGHNVGIGPRRDDLRRPALALAFRSSSCRLAVPRSTSRDEVPARPGRVDRAALRPALPRAAEIASYLVAASIVGGLVIIHDG
jgi:hypothetical protein